MPYGKGTYGSKVGRPPKKKTAAKKTKMCPKCGKKLAQSIDFLLLL